MSRAESKPTDLTPLMDRLGHQFGQPALLEEALTHPSVEARGRAARKHYDRLEFLGDRVLGVIVAEAMHGRFAAADAGELARRFNAVVRQETLARIAEGLNLGKYLRLSKSERDTGGAAKPAILADAVEAVIAALFLDGGFEVARRIVLHLVADHLDEAGGAAKDAKTALQEWAAARGIPTPTYRVVTQDGPAHQPRFTVAVTLPDHGTAEGSGGSKRIAEQAAARILLNQIEGAVS
ncbi:MAG: ribonuclease III [Alphaproteobacteria bacterium]|jgi:ribonuclease-3|nr:ribonuclease III [Alphaproteobacteria bacterium]